MLYTRLRTILLASITVLTCLLLSACPPGTATFRIKFINLGEHDVTGAFLFRVDESAGIEWGPNLLPFPLQQNEFVVLSQYFPKGPGYDLLVEFDGDAGGNGYLDSAILEAEDGSGGMQTYGADQFITWHAGSSGTPGNSSIGTGYNWGYNTFDGEIDVTPAR